MGQVRQRARRLMPAAIALVIAAGLVVASVGGADEAEDVMALSVLDQFERSESPLASGKWVALQWASSSGGTKTGAVTESGWRAVDSYPTVNGAFWNEKFSDKGNGDAVSAVMNEAPNSKSRYLALWLNMPEPEASKSGYQLSWTWTSEPEAPGSYEVALSRWISGSKTVLTSKSEQSIPVGKTVALSYKEGVLSAWTGTAPSLSKLLSTNDSWFASGYAGVEASGNSSRLQDFRAGTLIGELAEPCDPGTTLFGGGCWENSSSSGGETAAQASAKCTARGGELPDALALASFAGESGITLHSEGEWTSELWNYSGGKNVYAVAIAYDNGDIDSALTSNNKRYRCVLPVMP